MLLKLKSFLNKYILLIIVFITGAAVLVIEIAATRILSVYFGNTIFTVSSVLSVVLLALSLGYFIGGRLADKRASELLFYQLIAMSGLSVFLLQLLNYTIIPAISRSLSLQYGPLIASVLLFLLPGFLLGMLSPLVAKLQNMRRSALGIGQITGDVFFWSTLGSIFGSLATGFYLIPTFGVNQIIVCTGIVLLLIGLVGMTATRKTSITKNRLIVLLVLIPALQIGLVRLGDHAVKRSTVYAADGVYDSVYIYDGKYQGKSARFLQQSTDASSAMFLESSEMVYEYTKYYEVYKLTNPDIQNALVVGGGAYTVPKALFSDDPDVIIDVAEIEPDLFNVAKRYFNVPDDPRLQNHVEDGRRFLSNTEKAYDVIFMDAFHTAIPFHLTTKEFYELTKSKLTPEGVYIMNVIGKLSDTSPSFLMSQIKTFRSVFPNSYFFPVYGPDKNFAQNVMMVGYKSDTEVDFANAKTEDSFLKEIHKNMADITKYDLSSHPEFTDNYAPVEYFITHHQNL